LGIVKRLYADTAVSDFGPLALKAVRQEMVRLGWARSHINPQIHRVRRIFRWGVENELVPPSILRGLLAVAALRRGKTEAREREPVRPAAEAHVHAIKDHVSRQVWAMVELQLLTGMPPGEVTRMRTGDLDSTSQPWVYRPVRHKTENHGHKRIIYLGPKAQVVLRPFVRPNLEDYLFSPAEAEAERRAELATARKTPQSCGNRTGTNRQQRPRRRPGQRYTVNAYLRAIYAGCDAAFPPPPELARQRVPANGRKAKGGTRWETVAEWKTRLGTVQWARLQRWRREHLWHPNQLRHNAATRLRRDYGLEAAQVILGHKTLSVTEIYAEKNIAAAQRIMAEAG
jgi:integrase